MARKLWIIVTYLPTTPKIKVFVQDLLIEFSCDWGLGNPALCEKILHPDMWYSQSVGSQLFLEHLLFGQRCASIWSD
jgi:hypothetical protein